MIEKVSNPLFKEHLQQHDNPMKSMSEDMTSPPTIREVPELRSSPSRDFDHSKTTENKPDRVSR
jgi:hypothetical protein